MRFALKAGQPLGIARERFGQDLERHLALQAGIARAIHFTHSARTDLGGHFVRTKTCTDGERHEPR